MGRTETAQLPVSLGARPRLDLWSTSLTFLMLLLAFVPAIRVAGIPASTIFLLTPLLLIGRAPLDRSLLILNILALLYLSILSATNFYFRLGELKDALFFAIVIEAIIGYALVANLIQSHNLTFAIMTIKAFLLFQGVVMVAQLLDLGGIRSALAPYWVWLSTATTGDSIQGVALATGAESQRGYGTFGIPTLAGVLSYILARTIFVIERRRRWIALALLLILLSGHRMALLMFIIFEIVIATFTREHIGRWLLGMLAGFILVLITLGLFVWLEISKIYPNVLGWTLNLVLFDPAGGLMAFYSYSYRFSMFEWALSEPWMLLFGGLTMAGVPDTGFIDSELVMRSLQFGFFGLIALQFPYWYGAFRFPGKDSLFLLFIIVTMSAAGTLASQPYCIPFLLIAYRVIELRHRLVI